MKLTHSGGFVKMSSLKMKIFGKSTEFYAAIDGTASISLMGLHSLSVIDGIMRCRTARISSEQNGRSQQVVIIEPRRLILTSAISAWLEQADIFEFW